MNLNTLNYRLLRLVGLPIAFLSYKRIWQLGRILGSIAFYLLPWQRKITINQIALAKNLKLSREERHEIAKKSFQNLSITGLEYFKIPKSLTCLEQIVVCENPELPRKVYEKGKGMVLVSSHQANWELPFLDINSRHQGIAIGRPISNKKLYDWVLSIRQAYGGKIIEPKKAISLGVKHLKMGQFVGIVCDQALPESSYSCDFFGTRTFVSSSPALLSYKTGAPLLALSIQRREEKYFIKYSAPIYPQNSSLREGVKEMMDQAMQWMEKETILEQYFWQHRRYKQHPINAVKKKYRWDCFLVIADEKSLPDLEVLKSIYPRAFIDVFLPQNCTYEEPFFPYKSEEDLRIQDERYQVVLDFRGKSTLCKHFLKNGAFYFFDRFKLEKYAKNPQKHFLEEFFQKPG